jgi:hypothetical protein
MTREHTDSAECWCEPYLYHRSDVTGREVWVHRAAKRISSNGLHLGLMDNPAPEVLSAAIEMAENDDENGDPR